MWLTEGCGGRRRAVATPNRESGKEKKKICCSTTRCAMQAYEPMSLDITKNVRFVILQLQYACND